MAKKMVRKIGTIGVGVRKSSYGRPKVEVKEELDEYSLSICNECGEEFSDLDLYLCNDRLLCKKCMNSEKIEMDEISVEDVII